MIHHYNYFHNHHPLNSGQKHYEHIKIVLLQHVGLDNEGINNKEGNVEGNKDIKWAFVY